VAFTTGSGINLLLPAALTAIRYYDSSPEMIAHFQIMCRNQMRPECEPQTDIILYLDFSTKPLPR
jgi:hypothetical protein